MNNKKINVILLAILMLVGVSCSKRDEIPGIIEKIETAINANNAADLKKYISPDASDYNLLENNTFDWFEIVGNGTVFDFNTTDITVPEKGDDIDVNVPTTISTAPSINKNSTFNFVNEGTVEEDWKVLRIDIPTNAAGSQGNFLRTPSLQSSLPGFIRFVPAD
jgi:hypothetical protein